MTATLLTIYDVARLVGVKFYQIAYAHDAGFLREPPRFGGRRVYDDEMVESVRQFFNSRREKEVIDECDE